LIIGSLAWRMDNTLSLALCLQGMGELWMKLVLLETDGEDLLRAELDSYHPDLVWQFESGYQSPDVSFGFYDSSSQNSY
jgi:hypothetical protein